MEENTKNESVTPPIENTEAVPEANIEKPVELSPLQRIQNLQNESSAIHESILATTGRIQETNSKLTEIRNSLNLGPLTEEAPSIVAENTKLNKLTQRQALIEEEKNSILSQPGMTPPESQTAFTGPNAPDANHAEDADGAPDRATSENLGVTPLENKSEDSKEDNTDEQTQENTEEKEKEKVSEGLLGQIAEAIRAKNELSAKVSEMKGSSGFEMLQQFNLILSEKRQKLESLKKPPNTTGGGSFSGSMSGSISVEGNVSVGGDKEAEKIEISLEKQAENILTRTKIEILRLEKEELEYSPESLKIKSVEAALSLEQVQIEIDIWSGGMDEKTFSENMQRINNPETADQDFPNKELFKKFILASSNIESHREQNIGFYQKIDAKEKEIEALEKSAGDLECANEGEIMGMIRPETSTTEENTESKDGAWSATPNLDTPGGSEEAPNRSTAVNIDAEQPSSVS